MKIIFIHHAHRKQNHRQDDDITELGERDAKLTAELLEVAQQKGQNIVAIYTSPFFRCDKTAKLINTKINLPIFYDERLNEYKSIPNENWLDLQNRVRDCIKDIVDKYSENDCVICVTSGHNVAVFINLAYGLKPSANTPLIGVPSCSPLIFDIDKSKF